MMFNYKIPKLRTAEYVMWPFLIFILFFCRKTLIPLFNIQERTKVRILSNQYFKKNNMKFK